MAVKHAPRRESIARRAWIDPAPVHGVLRQLQPGRPHRMSAELSHARQSAPASAGHGGSTPAHETCEVRQTGGGSDGNFTAALGVPTLDGLGAMGDGAHAEHEHILLSHLPERTAFLAALLVEL